MQSTINKLNKKLTNVMFVIFNEKILASLILYDIHDNSHIYSLTLHLNLQSNYEYI